jgi:SAM-dependent MidA family methyltransferase
VDDDGDWLGWRRATELALYGDAGSVGGGDAGDGGGGAGFFVGGPGPAGHFRTSVHASGLFAAAVLALVRQVDRALGHPDEFVVTDVGAGRAELLLALGAHARAQDPALARRLLLRAVEKAPRPDGLPDWVHWTDRIVPAATGLLFANEWLDNVPVDIAEVDPEGVPRLVRVHRTTGAERLGEPVTGADAAWLARWWPLDAEHAEEGFRAEIGLPRDEAWAEAVASLGSGVAVAVDYAHRAGSRPPFGTLASFREGREVRPVPDGSRDLTSHVALDACLDAAVRGPVDVVHSLWTTQRDALRLLGVNGARPPLAQASSDPAGYLRALSAAGEAAELTASGGLGGFVWGVQSVGVPLPPEWHTLAS